VAAELGSSESAVKAAVHRMRRRFGKLLREEVAQTVGNPIEIDEELRHLFAVLE
jgi:RNA polymerase sigma-70 factor (ECF subfamily)